MGALALGVAEGDDAQREDCHGAGGRWVCCRVDRGILCTIEEDERHCGINDYECITTEQINTWNTTNLRNIFFFEKVWENPHGILQAIPRTTHISSRALLEVNIIIFIPKTFGFSAVC